MNTKLLGLLAAALATAACQQDKRSETTTTATPETTTTTTTTTTAPDTITFRTDARHLADRVTQDLAVADPAVKRRLENTYYTRARRIGEVQSRYTTDTTGRYQALRTANDQADEEVRTTLNNPTAYNSYSAHRAEYGDGPYSLAPTTATTTTTTTPAVRHTGSVGQGSGVKKLENQNDGDKKTKFENGAKIKRNNDGSVKIKMADGTKIKIDENGHRTVKKPLFK